MIPHFTDFAAVRSHIHAAALDWRLLGIMGLILFGVVMA